MGPGGEIFLKMTLFNSINGPKIVLKSTIDRVEKYHMPSGPWVRWQMTLFNTIFGPLIELKSVIFRKISPHGPGSNTNGKSVTTHSKKFKTHKS